VDVPIVELVIIVLLLLRLAIPVVLGRIRLLVHRRARHVL